MGKFLLAGEHRVAMPRISSYFSFKLISFISSPFSDSSFFTTEMFCRNDVMFAEVTCGLCVIRNLVLNAAGYPCECFVLKTIHI